MSLPSLDDLNDRFGQGDQLRFVEGPGGLPQLLLIVGEIEAAMALNGGQMLSFRRAGEPPVLWASRESIYQLGKAVRGGVPVCWPWFGPHPSDRSKPQHGFARTQLWTVEQTGADNAGVFARLSLRENDQTMDLWPHQFRLELTVNVGHSLTITLRTVNTGDQPFRFGGALHSYYAVGDVSTITVGGLDGVRYSDKVSGEDRTQNGPITIASEVDRVYHETTATCAIDDPALERQIVIAKSGSRSTVVWNPWVEASQKFSDLANDEYPHFVCVETALAHEDQIDLAPGESHDLSVTIAVGPLHSGG